MPQKRNPDMLELIRGRTGGVYGELTAIMTILKGIPTGYNRDLQQDKQHVFSAFDITASCIKMATAIIENTTFKTEQIKSSLDKGFLDATSLAEYLVKKSVPFRTAHGIVGKLVAYCEKNNKNSLSELSLEEFKKHCEKTKKDVYSYLGAENVVKKYTSNGAGGKKQAESQIKYWKKTLGER
jgi:argininosuccinate lyase